MIVVVEILVAQRKPEHPLADQRADLVLDQLAIATVHEAAGNQPDRSSRAASRRHPT
jgi:hypothetical protein